MTSTDRREENLAIAEDLVRKAAGEGSQWVLLPELFPFLGPYEKLFDASEVEGGPVSQRFATLAKELGIVLFCGTMGERPNANDPLPAEKTPHRQVYNTAYVFGRRGETIHKYRKTHLFNLKDATGKNLYCESDGFLAGHSLESLVVDGWRVTLATCYDLRFPGLFAKLSQKGDPDILVIPSAFTMATGMYHWELLLRARAVEHQAYVFSSNQTGMHGPGKVSFGHSMIIDPWGHKIADSGDHVGVASAIASRARIAQVRQRLPALANRRPELY